MDCNNDYPNIQSNREKSPLEEMADQILGIGPDDQNIVSAPTCEIGVEALLQFAELKQTTTENVTESENKTVQNEPCEGLDQAVNSAGRCLNIISNSVPTTPSPPSSPIQTSTVSLTSTVQPPAPAISATPTTTTTAATATATATPKSHIMISYSSTSRVACTTISDALKARGYDVWMDVSDMHDNFVAGMAEAIRDSRIVLMCIDHRYAESFWCRKEVEYSAVNQVKCIPCFLVEPFKPADWLDFMLGANVYVNFSDPNRFDESMNKLFREVEFFERSSGICLRNQITNVSTNTLTIDRQAIENEQFDNIVRTFKEWVEKNQQTLSRTNRKQSLKMVNDLIDSMKKEDDDREHLLQGVLLEVYQQRRRSVYSGALTPTYPMIKGCIVIMALWAIKMIFQQK